MITETVYLSHLHRQVLAINYITISRTLARLDGHAKIDVSVLNSLSLQQHQSSYLDLKCTPNTQSRKHTDIYNRYKHYRQNAEFGRFKLITTFDC